MTMTETTPSSAPLSGWQRRTLHTVTCNSNQRVRIRIPGLATLLEHGDLSQDLLAVAIAEITNPSGAAEWVTEPEDPEKRLERIRDYGRLQRELACAAIVAIETEPDVFVDVKLSADAVDELPEDDLSMIAEIVQRLRFRDAKGVRIGVEPLDRWAAFRAAHGCADEGCSGCAELTKQFSSADLGDL